jgi:hypothetical protein
MLQGTTTEKEWNDLGIKIINITLTVSNLQNGRDSSLQLFFLNALHFSGQKPKGQYTTLKIFYSLFVDITLITLPIN